MKREPTKYMQLKNEVAERAPQLKKDVEAIRMLLRDKYGFGVLASEFSMSEEALKGYKATGRYSSFNSCEPSISFHQRLPDVKGRLFDKTRGVHISISKGNYFIIGLTGYYKARGIDKGGKILLWLEECRGFLGDIRLINPRYLGESPHLLAGDE